MKEGRRYTPGVSERRSGSTSFLNADRLGSTTHLTDATEATTDTREYDAYGMTVSSTGSTATPFGFVGKAGYQQDADSGLMLLGHRYYDASTGRFITRDPVRDGRNWYVYCRENPLKFFDTRGLVPDKAYFDLVKSRHENNSVVVIIGETDGGNGDISEWVQTALEQVQAEHPDQQIIVGAPDTDKQFIQMASRAAYLYIFAHGDNSSPILPNGILDYETLDNLNKEREKRGVGAFKKITLFSCDSINTSADYAKKNAQAWARSSEGLQYFGFRGICPLVNLYGNRAMPNPDRYVYQP